MMKNQKGTALITGLVLLTVMSVVSVSTLESSIVQTSLSTNAQHKVIAFQEAETALKKASSPAYLLAAMVNADRKANLSYKNYERHEDDSDIGRHDRTSDTGKIEVKADIEYCGVLPSGSIKGMSLNADQAYNSSKKYVRYIFNISSTVNLIEGRQTKSKHSQRSSRLMMGSSDSSGETCG